MGGLFSKPKIPGPDPSIAENARLERERLRNEKTSTNKQIASKINADAGGVNPFPGAKLNIYG